MNVSPYFLRTIKDRKEMSRTCNSVNVNHLELWSTTWKKLWPNYPHTGVTIRFIANVRKPLDQCTTKGLVAKFEGEKEHYTCSFESIDGAGYLGLACVDQDAVPVLTFTMPGWC